MTEHKYIGFYSARTIEQLHCFSIRALSALVDFAVADIGSKVKSSVAKLLILVPSSYQ